MYAGEVNVSQVELPSLLRTAEALQVRGLADTTANNNNNFPPPMPQKHVSLKVLSISDSHLKEYGVDSGSFSTCSLFLVLVFNGYSIFFKSKE